MLSGDETGPSWDKVAANRSPSDWANVLGYSNDSGYGLAVQCLQTHAVKELPPCATDGGMAYSDRGILLYLFQA